nr:MAG TPA: hypothetical protein [Caudoviricetes sp.]
MASTNFKIFNEDHTDERTFNDSEYANATQRQSGVIPGIALSRLHNKLYFQVSSMCKAIADFIVGKGYDCNDDDVKTITENLGKAIVANGEEVVKSHNESTDAHGAMTSTIQDTLVPTSDTDTLRNQVSELANRIKAATGASGWKEAPAATLASLSKMIANLATGADVTWDGKKFTNHRLGITGLMDQNGYICFGPNCGGLIIQWGYTTYNSTPNGQAIVPAISFNTFFAGFVTDTGVRWNTGGTFVGLSYENNTLIFWPQYSGSPQTVSKNGTNYHWLIFCM